MRINKIFEEVKKSKRNNLTELESREILDYYKIPLVRGKVIQTINEAKQFIEKIGYPVVLKVISHNESLLLLFVRLVYPNQPLSSHQAPEYQVG